MTDDLHTRAREAAGEGRWGSIIATEAFADGALWHATQQPSREELVRVMREAGLYRRQADAILALFEGGDER